MFQWDTARLGPNATHLWPPSPPPPPPTADVAVIDNDDSLRVRLATLFSSVGLRALLLASPDQAVEEKRLACVRCLLMDVRMRGVNGLDLQERLHGLGIRTPVIFMTAHGDIPMSVRAMKAGAVDFLTKPLREQDVLEAVGKALERDRHERQRMVELLALATRLAALSSRERQVLHLVTAGLMNKQIAAELELSEVTVKMHRGSLMRKMGTRTVADLIRIALALEQAGPVFASALPAGADICLRPGRNCTGASPRHRLGAACRGEASRRVSSSGSVAREQEQGPLRRGPLPHLRLRARRTSNYGSQTTWPLP